MRSGRVGVLFVCTGNICRSPTAEAVFRKLVDDAGLSAAIVTDSAGTHDYHVGEPPDLRAQGAAAERGYDLSPLRARKIERADLQRFDLIVAMDRGHLGVLSRMAERASADKLKLMMSYASGFGERDVPDPYYGGREDFERVLDMLEDAARGLLDAIRRPAQR
jgi:protein-tyrosine phosphatase